jgi:hypothetical protein
MIIPCLVLAAVQAAPPCACEKPQAVEQVLSSAALIFEGTVVRAERNNIELTFDVGRMSYVENRILFVVDSLMKGRCGDTVEILMYEGRSECDIETVDFTFGERYLISAVPCADSPKKLCNDYCCLRTRLKRKPAAIAPLPSRSAGPASPAPPADSTPVSPDSTTVKKSWLSRLMFWKK